MKDDIKKRIELVKESDYVEHLVKHLCPFFEIGEHPDCMSCRKTESDVLECKDAYLERITKTPMEIWGPDFDKLLVESRNKIPIGEIVGIGVNCDSCYMYDKCPMFKSGFECAVDWNDNAPSTPEGFYDFLVSTQYERVRRASVFEKVDGGVPDVNLSNEMDRLSGFVEGKADLSRERFSLSVEATGASAGSGGGGILAKLFGGGGSTPKELPEKSADVIPIPTFDKNEDVAEAVLVEEETPTKKRRKRSERSKEA